MTKYQETQYRVVDKKMLSYPVESIEVRGENAFDIICRDTSSANDFRKITTVLMAANTTKSPGYEYTLVLSSDAESVFCLKGKDAVEALADFAYAGLFSQKLLEAVTGKDATQKAVCTLL